MREAPPSQERALLESWQQVALLKKRNGLIPAEPMEMPLFKRRCPEHGSYLDDALESEDGELQCPLGGEWREEWDVVRS